MNNDALNKTTN